MKVEMQVRTVKDSRSVTIISNLRITSLEGFDEPLRVINAAKALMKKEIEKESK